ncbi:MAG: BMP family ABC transporter substrate-binding protein [Spirochaetaceae bacterium]|jgi:basic membrane protein A|nr:BMP family ABC transporter substrate-binding protein [Spirochaetaceae bacterium]
MLFLSAVKTGRLQLISMKKLLLCAVILGIVSARVFSAPKQEPRNTQTSGASAEITVRLLTDSSGIDDRSFNAAAWRGILEFYGDTWENQRRRGKVYDVVSASTQDMYDPNIRQASDEGYDLIVTAGFTFADVLASAAKDYPNQQYLIIDVDTVRLPNVLNVVFAEHEGSYLVGAAAALKAKADGIANPRFGFIGGIPDPVITKFEIGFVQGVLSILPDAEIIDYYVNDWNDPGLAKTQAKTWYDAGVYAIYSAAGNSGNGTIAQAKEYRLQGKNIWAIGSDMDMYAMGQYNDTESAVLTSMLKRVETGVRYGLAAVKNKRFSGEVITLDLAAEGVGYAATNPALTQDIKRFLERIKQEIISGQISVAPTYTAAKKLPGFPQTLKAID